jgi:hypothetical protein
MLRRCVMHCTSSIKSDWVFISSSCVKSCKLRCSAFSEASACNFVNLLKVKYGEGKYKMLSCSRRLFKFSASVCNSLSSLYNCLSTASLSNRCYSTVEPLKYIPAEFTYLHFSTPGRRSLSLILVITRDMWSLLILMGCSILIRAFLTSLACLVVCNLKTFFVLNGKYSYAKICVF